MAIDMKKMKGMQADLKNKSGDGDGVMLYSSKLTEETQTRLLPPSEEMTGSYFVEQEGYWVNGKFYLSNITSILGGTEDVIGDEFEAAKVSDDEDVKALALKKNKYGIPVIKHEVRYLVPLVMLDVKYDDDDYVESVKELEAKVLVAKPTLMRKINALVTSKPYQNGKANGLLDQEKGWNVILQKTGAGKDTEYDAMGWTDSTTIDPKWYTDKVWKDIDPIKLTKEFAKSDAYLRSVVRNYLYGEPLLEDEKGVDKPSQAVGDKPKATRAAKPKVTLEEQEDVPAPKGNKRVSPASSEEGGNRAPKTKSRSLLEDAANELESM